MPNKNATKCPFKAGDIVEYLEWNRITQTNDEIVTFLALYPIPEECVPGREVWEVKYLISQERHEELNLDTWFAWNAFCGDLKVLSRANPK